VFVEKSPQNAAALVAALHDLDFAPDKQQEDEILRGKDFVQLKKALSTSTSSLRLTGSRDSTTRGGAASKWPVFQSLISTTGRRSDETR